MTRIGSLAQLPTVAEVRNDAPVERVEARELTLLVDVPASRPEGRAIGLPAPERPSDNAMEALAAAAGRHHADPRVARMFERVSLMLEMRQTVRAQRRGAGRA